MNVTAAAPTEFDWLASRTGWVFTERARAIKAVDQRGRIRGMVGYDEWTPNSCRAHMAVDSPIVWRSLHDPAFAYPFDELGKTLIIGIVAANNDRSVSMTSALGFRSKYLIKDGWSDGVPLIVFELRKRDHRTLSQKRRRHG